MDGLNILHLIQKTIPPLKWYRFVPSRFAGRSNVASRFDSNDLGDPFDPTWSAAWDEALAAFLTGPKGEPWSGESSQPAVSRL